MQVEAYLESIRATYASGQATEHSYRPALAALSARIDESLVRGMFANIGDGQ